MKKILIGLMFFYSSSLLAQDVSYEKDKIFVDDKEYATMEKTGCKAFSVECRYDLLNFSGSKEIVIVLRDYKDPREITTANKDGRVLYFEFVFLRSKQKAEIAFTGLKSEKLAKVIVKAKLFKDGQLDEKAVDEFVLINGTKFSERARS
jgi:hypothetical protein